MRIVVVLPAPLGPIKPKTSPFLRSNSSDLMANSSPYFFVRSWVSITGGFSLLDRNDKAIINQPLVAGVSAHGAAVALELGGALTGPADENSPANFDLIAQIDEVLIVVREAREFLASPQFVEHH